MQGSNFIHSSCYIFNCAAWTLPLTAHHSLIRKQRDNLSSSQDAALCSVRRAGWWTSGSHWISRFGYILLWQFSWHIVNQAFSSQTRQFMKFNFLSVLSVWNYMEIVPPLAPTVVVCETWWRYCILIFHDFVYIQSWFFLNGEAIDFGSNYGGLTFDSCVKYRSKTLGNVKMSDLHAKPFFVCTNMSWQPKILFKQVTLLCLGWNTLGVLCFDNVRMQHMLWNCLWASCDPMRPFVRNSDWLEKCWRISFLKPGI